MAWDDLDMADELEDDDVMVQYKFTLGIGIVGCNREEVVEIESYATDDEIEEVYQEWRNQFLTGGWKRL